MLDVGKARRCHTQSGIIKIYLFARFEDITLESVAAPVASDVAKYFQIVAIVRDVEYSKTHTILILLKNYFTEIALDVIYCF